MDDQNSNSDNKGINNQVYNSSSMLTEETPAIYPPISSEPSVVVPVNSKIPKWFYIIFFLTLVTFIVVTILLVSTLNQKNQPNKPVVTPTVIPSITQIIPTKTVPSPTLIISPTIAVDSALIKLNTLKNTDEIIDLEADLNETDFSTVEEAKINFDREMSVTSK